MATTAVQGVRTTGNFPDASQRPYNWRRVVQSIDFNGSTSLTGLLDKLKSRSVDDPQFYWWTKKQANRRLALGANLTTSNTTLTIVAGAGTQGGAYQCNEGTVLYVEETGEQMLVVQDPTSDTSLVVSRGHAGTTPATLDYDGTAINPNIIIIGNRREEGSAPPTSVTYAPTKYYNLCGIFRNTYDATNTAIETQLRTEPALIADKREDCLMAHMQDIERAMFFSTKSETTVNGKPARTIDGILAQMTANASANIVSAGATTSLAQLETHMKNAFLFGSNQKIAFTGNQGLLVLNRIIRKNTTANWNASPGVSKYGMTVNEIVCPFGTLNIVTHPMFNMLSSGTNAGSNAYNGIDSWLWILDPKSMQYVYLRNRDTRHETGLEANGTDGKQNGYLTECSLEIDNPEACYIIKGLTAAAADS